MQQKSASSVCSEFRLQAAGGDVAAPPPPANANARGAREPMQQNNDLLPPRPIQSGTKAAGWDPRRVEGLG